MWLAHEWQTLFRHRKHLFTKSFVKEGRVPKLYKICLTLSQSFLWKTQFCSIHTLKQVSIHGILYFLSIENHEGDSFVIPDSEKVALECMTSFPWNTFLSQREADTPNDSFPNKSHSILSCNHCSSQCCLLRLAKKNINYFQQKPCCVLIRKETVEELMVFR